MLNKIFLFLLVALNINAQPKTEPTPTTELQQKSVLTSDLPQKPKTRDITDLASGKSPKEIVRLFFALDLSGDRISDNNIQILKLTNWDKALHWDLYFAVEKWGIKSQQIKEDRAVVNVEFETSGRVVKNQYLLKEHQIEELELLLKLNKKLNLWQIVSEQFPPHVARSNIPTSIKELSIEKSDSSPRRNDDEGTKAHQ